MISRVKSTEALSEREYFAKSFEFEVRAFDIRGEEKQTRAYCSTAQEASDLALELADGEIGCAIHARTGGVGILYIGGIKVFPKK